MNKRQQIIAALKARLKLIKTPTYLTNVGDRVYVWRSKPAGTGELPMLNIYYAKDPDALLADKIKGPGLVWDRQLPVQISIETKSSEEAEEAEQIMSDILQAIGTDETLGGLAKAINAVDDSFNIEQAEHKIIGGEMQFMILYRTNQYEH